MLLWLGSIIGWPRLDLALLLWRKIEWILRHHLQKQTYESSTVLWSFIFFRSAKQDNFESSGLHPWYLGSRPERFEPIFHLIDLQHPCFNARLVGFQQDFLLQIRSWQCANNLRFHRLYCRQSFWALQSLPYFQFGFPGGRNLLRCPFNFLDRVSPLNCRMRFRKSRFPESSLYIRRWRSQ